MSPPRTDVERILGHLGRTFPDRRFPCTAANPCFARLQDPRVVARSESGPVSVLRECTSSWCRVAHRVGRSQARGAHLLVRADSWHPCARAYVLYALRRAEPNALHTPDRRRRGRPGRYSDPSRRSSSAPPNWGVLPRRSLPSHPTRSRTARRAEALWQGACATRSGRLEPTAICLPVIQGGLQVLTDQGRAMIGAPTGYPELDARRLSPGGDPRAGPASTTLRPYVPPRREGANPRRLATRSPRSGSYDIDLLDRRPSSTTCCKPRRSGGFSTSDGR